jgi:hypothetical protein
MTPSSVGTGISLGAWWTPDRAAPAPDRVLNLPSERELFDA